MTLRHLRWVLASVILVYATAIGFGILLWRAQQAHGGSGYQIYKDLMPPIIAIPAAYLAFAFQRRNSYVQALRSVWSHTVTGIAAALTYTDTSTPTQEQYLAILEKPSIAIEEVRGVYRNVPVKGCAGGWFPFEPIKQIYQQMIELEYGPDITPERRHEARRAIYAMWKPSRDRLLAEFDRDTPTFHHAEYATPGPRHGAAAPFKAG
jgi:hypothetical protein